MVETDESGIALVFKTLSDGVMKNDRALLKLIETLKDKVEELEVEIDMLKREMNRG